MNTSGFGSISAALLMGMAVSAMAQNPPEKPTFKEYLEKSALSREAMDRFLRGPSWGQFDPELGYILGNYLPTDGIAKSATISTVQTNGARTSFMYAGRKSRINTYGNSFTQGQQVSDGETWQEYLAGHLGEPIRNFGVGGYGVYQTYRRMVREEKTDHSADHLIFYIWGDDHIRSLLRCRHASIYQWWDHQGGTMFQGNFWSNLEMDLETGRFVEKENLLPTTKSLYHMTEPKWMADHLQDDLALQLLAFKEGRCRDLDQARTNKLAANLDFQFDWSNPATLRSQAGQLLDRYSLRATRFILDKARTFAAQNKKKLLVVLFDPNRSMADLKANRPRYDQEIADYLTREKFSYFDMNEVHIRDFRKYNLSFEDYKKQYLMGHYNPAGNHFFAYSIKDKVLELLDPKPITYQKRDPQTIDFKDYLQSPAPKPAPAGGKGMGPLRVHPTNPRYFTDGTKNPDGSVRAVYLTGSHTWNNLVDMGRDDPPKAFDFDAYLDFLVRHDHNFIRMWAWDSTTWDLKSSQSWTDQKDVFKTSPQPWQRTGPGKALDGKPKFDLEKFDPAYFERLRARVKAAGDRGIYVSVMLFEGWALRFDPTSWGGHPFRMANNVQGINGDPNGDGKGLEIQTLTIPKITALQEAYVRKVIDTINDLDNVLYEVSNEANLLNPSTSTKDWQYHIIRFIKNEEAKKPRQHPVGMTSQGFGGGDDCEILRNSPADWISPNPDKFDFKNNPPASDGKKVVLLDTDHLWGIGGDAAWVWKSFLRGHNPLFMDPYEHDILGKGRPDQWEGARQAMGATRGLAKRIDLAKMTPSLDLASTKYCLAKPGQEYLVYQPKIENFSVNLTVGNYAFEWFDPTKRSVASTGSVKAAGGNQTFTPPFSGPAVLYLKFANSDR